MRILYICKPTVLPKINVTLQEASSRTKMNTVGSFVQRIPYLLKEPKYPHHHLRSLSWEAEAEGTVLS